MIQCRQCKGLWPSGTVWCGTCCATLGCRMCPDGHASPLGARCCVTCGSKKLSNGVAVIQLRVYTSILTVGMSLLVVVIVLPLLLSAGRAVLSWLMSVLLPYIWLSVLIALLGGPKARRIVLRVWLFPFRRFGIRPLNPILTLARKSKS